MRGDTNGPKEEPARDATETAVCGFNVLKVARYANLIVGTALSVVCGINIFNFFGANAPW